MSLNRVILLGRLGRDPDLKQTNGGSEVCTFTLATDAYKEGSEPDWHNVECWGKTAELCAKYISKGSQVCIEGSVHTKTYENKDGESRHVTYIKARNVHFMGSSNKNSQDNQQSDDVPF